MHTLLLDSHNNLSVLELETAFLLFCCSLNTRHRIQYANTFYLLISNPSFMQFEVLISF